MSRFERQTDIVGTSGLEKLRDSKVIVFGIGGVGGYVAEMLVRSGVGKVDVVDKDIIEETNINRQIIALTSTIGKNKVDVMKERLLDINPNLDVTAYKMFYLPDTADQIDLSKYDYVCDAVDNVTAKIELIVRAKKAGVKIISAMGTGLRIDSSFVVGDISETTNCRLARAVRQRLKKLAITDVTVAYSNKVYVKKGENVSSIAYVPASSAVVIAEKIIKDILGL